MHVVRMANTRVTNSETEYALPERKLAVLKERMRDMYIRHERSVHDVRVSRRQQARVEALRRGLPGAGGIELVSAEDTAAEEARATAAADLAFGGASTTDVPGAYTEQDVAELDAMFEAEIRAAAAAAATMGEAAGSQALTEEQIEEKIAQMRRFLPPAIAPLALPTPVHSEEAGDEGDYEGDAEADADAEAEAEVGHIETESESGVEVGVAMVDGN